MLYSLAALIPLALQATHVPLAPAGMNSYSAFGYGLDVCGDTAVAGAYLGSGSPVHDGFVQFYERDPASGSWTPDLLLTGESYERLGFDVAIDGDVAVLGHQSPQERPVRVMERIGGSWIQTATLAYPGAPGSNGSTGFGSEVDVSGGIIAVGAPEARDGGGGVTGAVYLFEKQQGQWVQRQKLLPPPNPSSGQFPLNTGFGRRVDIDGDTVAVNAWFAPVNGSGSAGRVHVYALAGNSFLIQRSILSPLLPGSFRFGGYGFGLSGDTLAVGSIGTTVDGVNSAGMVHVYERTSGSWTETTRLVDPAPSTRGYFGEGVAVDGNRIVVGRSPYFRRTQAQERLGLVSFSRAAAGGSWDLVEEIFDPLEAGNTCFGYRVSLDGDRMISSAPCAVVAGAPVGALYVTDLSQDTAPLATVACGGGPCSCAPREPWLGCGNSTREFAELSAFGSASIARDDLSFAVRDIVPNVLARLALGPALAPQRPVGDGMLCIGDPRQLMPRMTEPNGTLIIPGGVVSRAASQLGSTGMIFPGETWFFQVIYHEPRTLFPCRLHDQTTFTPNVQNGRPFLVDRGFNLTGGLAVTWRP